MKFQYLFILSFVLLAQSALGLGKDPMTTGLHCVMPLPDDGSGVAKQATVDINAVAKDRRATSIVLTQPGSDPKKPTVLTLPYGDPNSTTTGTSTVMANEINNIKETKYRVIDPAIGDGSDGTPASDINVVFQLKVKYQQDKTSGVVNYQGSLFYSLQDPQKNVVQGGAAVTCTCVNVAVASHPAITCPAMKAKTSPSKS